MHCCALPNVYRGPCCCGDFRTDYAIFDAPEKNVTKFHGLAKWCPLGPLVHRMAVNRSIVGCHSHNARGLSGCGCCHHCIAWIFRDEKLAENHEILRSSNMAIWKILPWIPLPCSMIGRYFVSFCFLLRPLISGTTWNNPKFEQELEPFMVEVETKEQLGRGRNSLVGIGQQKTGYYNDMCFSWWYDMNIIIDF